MVYVVSPGFEPRPSLSVVGCKIIRDYLVVSPGFEPRPSLSVRDRPVRERHGLVSPGFEPRPSLSAYAAANLREVLAGVAGVRTPAFVERSTTWN